MKNLTPDEVRLYAQSVLNITHCNGLLAKEYLQPEPNVGRITRQLNLIKDNIDTLTELNRLIGGGKRN